MIYLPNRIESRLQRAKISVYWKIVSVIFLKVPKRENFSLSFFALSEPIWVCDLGNGEKNRIFYQLTPDFDGFLPHTECAVNKKKF
jgi:hypothetical protein